MIVSFIEGGHNHCVEVFRIKDYNLIVIILALLVVCSSTEKVHLFVSGAGLMMEGEVVFC